MQFVLIKDFPPSRTRSFSWLTPSSAGSRGTRWLRLTAWPVLPLLCQTTASMCRWWSRLRAHPPCPTASPSCRYCIRYSTTATYGQLPDQHQFYVLFSAAGDRRHVSTSDLSQRLGRVSCSHGLQERGAKPRPLRP